MQSDAFKGLANVANSKVVFEGFGTHETKDYAEAQELDVVPEAVASDLMIGVDRDLDGRMNFAE